MERQCVVGSYLLQRGILANTLLISLFSYALYNLRCNSK
jgi:hypothetical protein